MDRDVLYSLTCLLLLWTISHIFLSKPLAIVGLVTLIWVLLTFFSIDDIFVFNKTNLSLYEGLILALIAFKEASDLGANITKSIICFSKLADSLTKHQMINIVFLLSPSSLEIP